MARYSPPPYLSGVAYSIAPVARYPKTPSYYDISGWDLRCYNW
jgi:hypothetical protein